MKIKCIIAFISLLTCLVILPVCSSFNNSQITPFMVIITPNVELTTPISKPLQNQTITPQPVIFQSTITPETIINDPIMVINNCAELLGTFNQKLKTTGWIRRVFTILYFDNMKKEYRDPQVKEEWYRLSPNDQLLEAYNWVSTTAGDVQQEAFFQDGIWYNVTNGQSSHSPNTRPDFTGGFAEQLKSAEKITQEVITYHEADTWRFYLEIEEGGLRTARVLYIDQKSGLITGDEIYEVQPGKDPKLVSGISITSFEINADPPLQKFQQILEKAPKH